jgi:hypothetical protein
MFNFLFMDVKKNALKTSKIMIILSLLCGGISTLCFCLSLISYRNFYLPADSIWYYLLVAGVFLYLPTVLFGIGAIVLSFNAGINCGITRLIIFMISTVIFVTIALNTHHSTLETYKKNVLGEISLKQLYKATLDYANEHDGYLPIADKWCDLLISNDKISKEIFKNKADQEGICSFAFNKNISGLKLSELPKNTVLLFRASGDWNLTGTAESFKKTCEENGEVGLMFIDGTFGKIYFLYKEADCGQLGFRSLNWLSKD